MIVIVGSLAVFGGLGIIGFAHIWLGRIWREIPDCNEDFVLY